MEPIVPCEGIRFCCSGQIKGCGKVGTASEEGTLVKFIVEKAPEITKDDAEIIQHEKDVLMEVPNLATEKELKEVVLDIEK